MSEVRVEMKHEACGGKADLIILLEPGKVTYQVVCRECGYAESWLTNQTKNTLVQ